MNIVIFGPPGAGKGTQSNFIVKKYNLHQLSTGELLRKEIKDRTNLGLQIESIINSGNLVSNEIASNLIEKYISNPNYNNRLIFDGYPRNLIQVKNLDRLLKKYNQKIDLVLKLSVNLDTIKKRILERKTLEQRADDSEKIAIRRYEMYEKNIEPVIEFYNQSESKSPIYLSHRQQIRQSRTLPRWRCLIYTLGIIATDKEYIESHGKITCIAN